MCRTSNHDSGKALQGPWLDGINKMVGKAWASKKKRNTFAPAFSDATVV